MYSTFQKIARCPFTQRPLRVDEHGLSTTVGTEQFYPIDDGIIDFIPNQKDRISNAYNSASSDYDHFLEARRFLPKLYNKLIWGFVDDLSISEDAINTVPSDFDGVILDIPIGTGIYGRHKYSTLHHAKLFGLDYSMNMLRQAKSKFDELRIENSLFIHGDVARLPFVDSCIDYIISFNSFHAFPDKQAALREMVRTLKPGGSIIGSFYICKERWITDRMISLYYEKKGWFTPPFFTYQQAKAFFSLDFKLDVIGKIHSMLIFRAQKSA